LIKRSDIVAAKNAIGVLILSIDATERESEDTMENLDEPDGIVKKSLTLLQ